MDIWNVHQGVEGIGEGPRSATRAEMVAYLAGLAEAHGLTVDHRHIDMHLHGMTVGEITARGGFVEGCNRRSPDTYATGSFSIPMPGYGRRDIVTMDILDDAGDVVRTISLPEKPRGKDVLPITKAQLQTYSGIEPSRKKRAKAISAPVSVDEAAIAPARQPVVSPVPAASPPTIPAASELERSLLARVEALEAVIARLGIADGADVAVPSPAGRTDAHARAILRAWRIRADRRRLAHQHRLDVERIAAVTAERDAAIARADAMAAKRLAIHATLQRMRTRREAMASELESARSEARSAVSAMSVLTERWAAVQAHRAEPVNVWAPPRGPALHLAAGHA